MEKKNTVRAFLGGVVFIAFIFISCSSGGNNHNNDAASAQREMASSEKQRITPLNVTDSDLVDLVAGNSTFAFDLYQHIREEEENIIYSPYSISLALAMTWAGAAGETEQQMAEVLNFFPSQDELHPAFNLLDLEMESRGEGAEGTDSQGFQLNIANAVWGQSGYSFLAAFLDVLAENYGAGLRLQDFQASPEDARVTINNWVSEQTEERIQDLIPKNAITVDTRLVLTNAIYFNAAWAFPFDEEATQPAPFTLYNGEEITTDMMTHAEYYGYARGQGYQALEIPYDGLELTMLLLVPDRGEFAAFESTLNADRVDAIISEMAATNVIAAMPKFSFETSIRLNEILADMGMPNAFDPPVANFSRMDGERNLCLSDVLHKAFILVDENGTEAAAATAVIATLTGMPELPVEVSIDRPFIFLIRDLQTQTILFVGRVLNPEA